MYASTSELPFCLRAVLTAVGYGKADISVKAATTVTLSDCGTEGRRAFVAIVNLETGDNQITWGSWGGSNMFNPGNAVDNDSSVHNLPPNGAVVQGSIGGSSPVYATIAVHPTALAPMLPARPELTEKEAGILRAFKSLKSGPYRKDALHALDCASEDLNALIGKGLLKQSSNGATAITTKGKNAIS